ncbi:MAG: hypothetical protein IV094_11825 [Vitreoscilla sp.]|nr:hypothetical protein [Vitreoscilla sp.]
MSDEIITASIGLFGVLLGGLLTIGADQWARHRKKKEEQAYLAILVVSELDRFVNGCLSVARDNGTAYGRPAGDDQYYKPTVKAPEFAPLNIDVEWRVLPQDLLYAILAIPDKRKQLDSWIFGYTEHDDEDGSDYIVERQLGYAELGLDVSGTARDLRAHAKLPIEDGSNFRNDEFGEIIAKMRALKEKRSGQD